MTNPIFDTAAPWLLGKTPEGISPVEPSDLPRCCVFCGTKPDAKNLEHIIPMWLIKEYSSAGNEPALYSYALNKMLRCRTTPFPSCESCNNQYSSLESHAKQSLHEVIHHGSLKQADAKYLLDWFDKLRIGTSLAGLKLLGKESGMSPPNVISSRMGREDRLLYIFRGPRTPRIFVQPLDGFAFRVHPSSFFINISGYCFLSVSEPGLASNTLGIRQYTRVYHGRVEQHVHYTIRNSTRTIRRPVFDIRPRGAVVLLQSISPNVLEDDSGALSVDKSNCISSPIFIYRQGNIKEVGRLGTRLDIPRFNVKELEDRFKMLMKDVHKNSLTHLQARTEDAAKLQVLYRTLVNHGPHQATQYLNKHGRQAEGLGEPSEA